jgi:hypothetical protein
VPGTNGTVGGSGLSWAQGAIGAGPEDWYISDSLRVILWR